MPDNNENEKMALDPLAQIPQPTDADIVHMYRMTTGVDLIFSMDYAGQE